MIEIEDKIVSSELFEQCFSCDLRRCRGMCCVEGDAGAPLEAGEIDALERDLDAIRPYMKPAGIEAVGRQGVFTVDTDGDYVTPLIGGRECAFSVEEGGTVYCAIEKAWRAGKTAFRKPVSCHLYPIRTARFSNGTIGLNYHRWDICRDAEIRGRCRGIPVYRSLKTALVRAFGESFYQRLEAADRLLRSASADKDEQRQEG